MPGGRASTSMCDYRIQGGRNVRFHRSLARWGSFLTSAMRHYLSRPASILMIESRALKGPRRKQR